MCPTGFIRAKGAVALPTMVTVVTGTEVNDFAIGDVGEDDAPGEVPVGTQATSIIGHEEAGGFGVGKGVGTCRAEMVDECFRVTQGHSEEEAADGLVGEAPSVEVGAGFGVAAIEEPGVSPERRGCVELAVGRDVLWTGFRGEPVGSSLRKGNRPRWGIDSAVGMGSVLIELFEEPARLADTTPEALSRATTTGFHPDMEAVSPTINTEGTGAGVETTVAAGEP